jgi:hypothetical protein
VTLSVDTPTVRIHWSPYHRLISSAFPAIDLFDDIANPEDWPLLGSAESKTNPRINTSVGNLDLVPVQHRVGGIGATFVMAPFTHISRDRPGRFHDGSFGVFYAADSFDTAVIETAHHRGKFYQATAETPGWIAEMRELVGTIDAQLLDIRNPAYTHLHAPDNYTDSQAFASKQRTHGANGIVYHSVRNPGGECFAAFHPDVMSIPKQSRHLVYHWNGERIDQIKLLNAEHTVYRINQ